MDDRIVFHADVWDDVKALDADIAVGDMERLEELADRDGATLSFGAAVWQHAKDARADIAVGDMERLESYAGLTTVG